MKQASTACYLLRQPRETKGKMMLMYSITRYRVSIIIMLGARWGRSSQWRVCRMQRETWATGPCTWQLPRANGPCAACCSAAVLLWYAPSPGMRPSQWCACCLCARVCWWWSRQVQHSVGGCRLLLSGKRGLRLS